VELASCALLWGVGCAAIGLGRRQIRRRVEERDQAEQALRRAHDELEQRIAERTTELSVANRLLREEIATRERVQGELEHQRVRAAQADRLYALGGMAAGLAHELNQPLMGIAATVTDILLRLDEGRQLGAELLQEMLEDTVVQVDRMSEIIGHLLIFSSDREDQAPVRFRVRDAVLGGMRLTAAQLRVHGIAVRVTIPDDLPDVDGWPSRLEQALVSLIANARDALDDRRSRSPGEADGVDPGRCPTLEVRATPDPDGTSVRLSVSDNGGGIPEAVLPRIFEPFFTTREVGKGTGLGLAVCKGIADQHGGQIEVDNRPGEGVTFTIVLPASKAVNDPRRDQPS
jgi:two-component system C4-dicarboxylate transport sensor histidine kinase DctB